MAKIVCKRCGAEKEDFNFSRQTMNKYRPYCLECERKRCKESYPKRRDKKLAQHKVWRTKNKELFKIKRKIYKKKKRKKDIQFKLKERLRSRFFLAINKEYKKSSVLKLLGLEIKDFRNYLESKFENGMNWENWGYGDGKWVIDHIVPCSKFDLTKEEEQHKCFYYTNMQPLWWKDNLDKRAKLDWIKPENYIK